MTEILDRIVAHLRRLERGAPDRLQRGLTSEELAGWEAKLSFQLTGELETMYRWRDGTGEEPADVFEMRYLFPGYYFVPMVEAAEIYRIHHQFDPAWLPGWFPLFSNGSGDFFIIPCGQVRVPSGPVLGWEHGQPEHNAEYESVTSMLQTLEAAFREGAFFLDDDDFMDVDQAQYGNIARRFNGTLPKWQR